MLAFTGITVESVSAALSAHEAPTPRWSGAEFTAYNKVAWPAIMWTGWYDILQNSQLAEWFGYTEQSSLIMRGLHRLVIDPYGHCALHGAPPNGLPGNTTAQSLTQGAYFLGTTIMTAIFKDATNFLSNGLALAKWRIAINSIPHIVMYVLGSYRQYVTGLDAFPKPRTLLSYYLTSAQTLAPDAVKGTSPPRGAIYDPAGPCP
eukprot:303830_1